MSSDEDRRAIPADDGGPWQCMQGAEPISDPAVDPVAWLRIQIGAMKAAAIAAQGGHWRADRDQCCVLDEDCGFVAETSGGFDTDREATVAHIVMNDPRNVVADCDAKLAILDEHGGEHMCYENNTWDWYIGDCRVVRRLASAYKHWSGYREEDWKQP